MKIIKRTTGIIEVTQQDVILQTLQPVASLQLLSGDDGVQVTDVNGRVFDFYTRSIRQIQIDPAAPTEFTGDTQDLIQELEDSLFNQTPSGGGGADPVVEKGTTPPVDTNLLWFDTLQNELYYYDSAQSKWLSDQVYSIVFNDNANTGNGVFLRVGQTQTTTGEGYPIVERLNAFAFKYTNIRQLSDQSYLFYRDATAVITQDVTMSRTGLQTFTALTIQPAATLACQHLGTTNQDTVIELLYRKEYTDFILILSRIESTGSGNYTLEVNFIGSDTQFINSIEWNFEEPFSGPDPIDNPVNLAEQSTGVWTLDNQTFDGDPTGEAYDITLTFTGTNSYARQEFVTITV